MFTMTTYSGFKMGIVSYYAMFYPVITVIERFYTVYITMLFHYSENTNIHTYI